MVALSISLIRYHLFPIKMIDLTGSQPAEGYGRDKSIISSKKEDNHSLFISKITTVETLLFMIIRILDTNRIDKILQAYAFIWSKKKGIIIFRNYLKQL